MFIFGIQLSALARGCLLGQCGAIPVSGDLQRILLQKGGTTREWFFRKYLS